MGPEGQRLCNNMNICCATISLSIYQSQPLFNPSRAFLGLPPHRREERAECAKAGVVRRNGMEWNGVRPVAIAQSSLFTSVA